MKYALLCIAVGAGGCSGIQDYTTVVRLRETNYERTPEVEFFEESQTPARAYDVIAKLETRMEGDEQWGTLYDSMRERAKTIGADGVMNLEESTEVGDTTTNSFNWPVIGSTATTSMEKSKILKGKAIKYK